MRIVLIISLVLNVVLFLRLIFTQGVLEVDESNKDKPRWLFLLTTSTDNIYNHKRLVFKIKNVTEIVKKSKDAEKSTDIIEEDNKHES